MGAREHVKRLVAEVLEEDAKAATRTLLEHLGHGGLRVELPDSWCACGVNLGCAIQIKAGSVLLSQLLDEVEARRG